MFCVFIKAPSSGPDEATRSKSVARRQAEGREQAARGRGLQLHEDVEVVHHTPEPREAMDLLQNLPRPLLLKRIGARNHSKVNRKPLENLSKSSWKSIETR